MAGHKPGFEVVGIERDEFWSVNFSFTKHSSYSFVHKIYMVMKVAFCVGANEKANTIYPWMKVVAYRNDLPINTVLRIWNLHAGQIINLKSKPGTKAAQFVTPSGVLTQKYHVLIEELESERRNYLYQTGKS